MRSLSRRIRQLEERTGYKNQVVYFIDVDDLTEAELNKEVQAINQRDPTAIIFIDDIPLEDGDNFEN